MGYSSLSISMSESEVCCICVKSDSFFKVCKSSGLILKYFLDMAIWAGEISLKLCYTEDPPERPFWESPNIRFDSCSGVKCRCIPPMPESLNFCLISGLTNLRSIRSLSISGWPVKRSSKPYWSSSGKDYKNL